MRHIAAALSLLLGMNVQVVAQTPADEAAIRSIEDHYNDAWNRHDAVGMVESMAADAQFVTVVGFWTRTRDQFLQVQQRLQAGQFKDSVRKTLEMQIQFLSPEVAIVHSRFSVASDRDPSGKPRNPREVLGTRVVQRREGSWQTIADQNTNVLAQTH